MKNMLRRTGLLLLALVLLVSLGIPVFADTIPDAPDSYVYDGADVLSRDTEDYVNGLNAELDRACGAQIAVVTVDFTGAYDTADYAYELFNKWGIGDKKKNNGLLFLLVTGAEDYYALPGSGITDVFTGGKLDALLRDYMENDFAAGDYDKAVRRSFDRALSMLQAHYGLDGSYTADVYETQSGAYRVGRAFYVLGKIIIFLGVILIAALIIIRVSGGPRGPRGPRGGGGDGFWRGMMLGSMMNRSRYYRRPPPPPYGGFGGPRPPRPPRRNPPGGFGGFGGGGSFGGFGGGGSRGGGAGRR